MTGLRPPKDHSARRNQPASDPEAAATNDSRALGFPWLSLAFVGFFRREKPRKAKVGRPKSQ
jgi:hypothetical protein